MQDMRDLYRAYSAVHDTTIKEELDISKDQITTMNLGQLTESDLVEICEEIVEGLFQYGCSVDTAHEVVGSVMEATVEGELPAHRQEKIVRISEAFDKVFEKVATRAERNCEEEFLKYRTNKPLTEKWNNKVSHENGNEKLHAALIHKDREIIKGGLVEMISKVIEEKKDDSYLEVDMKKREKNNEKARKDMEKVKGQKNPHFEEVSTLRQGWSKAYMAMYEKKLDPVGQEDGDIDNDGDKDSSDKYLAKRRKAIGKAMKEGKMSDEDIKKRVGYTSDETRQKKLDKIKVKSMKKEETEVEEGYKELSRDKRNTMFRKAGNLSRTALQGGDKGTEAHKKSGKIVKALNKDAEKNDRNDVKSVDEKFVFPGKKKQDQMSKQMDGVHSKVKPIPDDEERQKAQVKRNDRVRSMDNTLDDIKTDTKNYVDNARAKKAANVAKGKAMKKEEVSFSETELKAFEQIVNSWVD